MLFLQSANKDSKGLSLQKYFRLKILGHFLFGCAKRLEYKINIALQNARFCIQCITKGKFLFQIGLYFLSNTKHHASNYVVIFQLANFLFNLF